MLCQNIVECGNKYVEDVLVMMSAKISTSEEEEDQLGSLNDSKDFDSESEGESSCSPNKRARLSLTTSSCEPPVDALITQNAKVQTSPTETPDAEEIDIEKECMPHHWSTKFSTPEKVLEHYMNYIITESETATNSILHEKDVIYNTFHGQKLDIFGTDLPDDAPIVIYVHGGFWKKISKDISSFPAISFHKSGFKTFIVGYDQRRKVTLWDIVDQVQDALMYVLQLAEEKGSRGVYLVGHSSGAHLIAQVLSNYEIIDCRIIKHLCGVFLISGFYDLRDICYTAAADVVKLSEIDAVSFSPLLSNYNHLQHSETNFYVFAAQEDSPTFKKQSKDFYEYLFNICPMKNMYFEIKDDMDHYEMVKCLTNDDNYIKRLILHDLNKHS